MPSSVMVEFNGETVSASVLAKRIGVSDTCIIRRWQRGVTGADLVAPSTRPVPHTVTRKVPKTREEREMRAHADALRRAEQAASNRSRELRQDEKNKAERIAREIVALAARPLIDAKLLTRAERNAIRQKVRGCQRWNGGWFGESHDSRETR